MYKLVNDKDENKLSSITKKDNSGVTLSIPVSIDNTDYQTFKKDLAEGASLKDAEGNDMTAEQITTFLGTLA
jgi:hypothetical protein